MASVFCYLQILYMNIREIVFTRVKSEIQIRNLKNPKSAKLNSCKNLLPHDFRTCGNCELFCLSCNFSAPEPDFSNYAFGNSVNFSGKKVTAHPPPPPSLKVPVRLWASQQHDCYLTYSISVHAVFSPGQTTQHANPTYRNIVGCNMLHAFGHRVATCWVLLLVGSRTRSRGRGLFFF